MPNRCTYVGVNEWMNEWMNDWMNGWTDGWMDGWINEWKDEWNTFLWATELPLLWLLWWLPSKQIGRVFLAWSWGICRPPNVTYMTNLCNCIPVSFEVLWRPCRMKQTSRLGFQFFRCCEVDCARVRLTMVYPRKLIMQCHTKIYLNTEVRVPDRPRPGKV